MITEGFPPYRALIQRTGRAVAMDRLDKPLDDIVKGNRKPAGKKNAGKKGAGKKAPPKAKKSAGVVRKAKPTTVARSILGNGAGKGASRFATKSLNSFDKFYRRYNLECCLLIDN